jgi:hypothetical protein
MYFSKVRDPVIQIAITTYNAVTAFVMVFHFLEFMAGLAVKINEDTLRGPLRRTF